MTLEVRDVEAVKFTATSIVVTISMTRVPDEVEVDLINAWPTGADDGGTLAYEKRLLTTEVPSAEAAVASVRFLMGPHGLAAISARAEAVRDESEHLLRGLQDMVASRYTAGGDPAP